MYIFKNAFKSLLRSKGRNILIGIIVFSIAVSSCIALSIKYAAIDAEKNGIEQMNVTASIILNSEKLMEEAQNQNSNGNSDGFRSMMREYQSISLDEMKTYSNSDYVKDFYYTNSTSINASDDFVPVSTEEENNENEAFENNNGNGMMQGGPPAGGRMIRFGGMSMGDFTITGYSDENAMVNFLNGTSQITEGNMFDVAADDYKCIISKELAAFNDLSVGSKISLTNPNVETEKYELTVAGIYTNTSTDQANNMPRFSTSMDPLNLICVSTETLNNIVEKSEAVSTTQTDDTGNEYETKLTTQDNGTYAFENKENYEKFSEEVKTKGLSDYYTVTSSDLQTFEDGLVPLKNLDNFATNLLMIILAVGAVVLIVINVFNIRERKYEVGVLTAIGIKKSKVALQFVIELLSVTLIAIIIGTGAGAVASVPVANNLLASQITAQEEKAEEQSQNFGRPSGGQAVRGPVLIQGGPGGANFNMRGFGDQDVDYLDQINATININILGQLIAIGVILTIISSLAAIIFVLRYEPLKILANRT